MLGCLFNHLAENTLVVPSFVSVMKGLSLILAVLFASILYLDAFLPSPRVQNAKYRRGGEGLQPNTISFPNDGALRQMKSNPGSDDSLEHGDILWKLRPADGVSRRRRLWLRFAANAIRLDCMLKRQEPPLVLCPKGGHAVLEAHYRPTSSSKYEKIARFGFTTERGPSNEAIRETVTDIYGIDKKYIVGVGAIVYMFVEPDHRKKNIGSLALETISMIHAIQGCDFTVLVVDDNGSGKLVEWYKTHGYSLAPKLQDVMGSPNAIHGVTMIAPTQQTLPENFFLRWW
jgi:GNAT superfamily N-acetyltransferase